MSCCKAQVNWNDVTYVAPFDSLSLEFHKQKINMGFGYLLLVKADSMTFGEQYYLVDTNWLGPENGKKHSLQSIDSLLNGKIGKENAKGLIPINKELLDIYAVKDVCDLVNVVFDKDGIYRPPPFYASSKLILSSLVQRGAIIVVEDFDGTPLLDIKSINCR
jgi:hypothetical protein